MRDGLSRRRAPFVVGLGFCWPEEEDQPLSPWRCSCRLSHDLTVQGDGKTSLVQLPNFWRLAHGIRHARGWFTDSIAKGRRPPPTAPACRGGRRCKSPKAIGLR